MSTKPILFSTPMVQAIFEGRKSQTRRVIPEKKVDEYCDYDEYVNAVATGVPHIRDYEDSFFKKRARYQPGDILWVRETWKPQDYQFIDGMWNCAIVYKAGGMEGRVYWPDGTDSVYERCGIWRPSIHMPREAARLFLRVVSVRVEKLQDMPLFDVWDEGTPQMPGNLDSDGAVNQRDFRYLWDSLNAKRGYGWDKNPWVWVYSFERVEKPAGWPGGEVD